ncbi:hypothetical protein ABIC16_003717 [Sphingomonas sp. PvP055]
MARSINQAAVIDIKLADGMAFGMGEGAYLIVQHDEYGHRHAVLVTPETLKAIGAVERARSGGVAGAIMKKASEGALEARTALVGLRHRVGSQWGAKALGDSQGTQAGLSAA